MKSAAKFVVPGLRARIASRWSREVISVDIQTMYQQNKSYSRSPSRRRSYPSSANPDEPDTWCSVVDCASRRSVYVLTSSESGRSSDQVELARVKCMNPVARRKCDGQLTVIAHGCLTAASSVRVPRARSEMIRRSAVGMASSIGAGVAAGAEHVRYRAAGSSWKPGEQNNVVVDRCTGTICACLPWPRR